MINRDEYYQAIDVIAATLSKDKELYNAWISNISRCVDTSWTGNIPRHSVERGIRLFLDSLIRRNVESKIEEIIK
jgi:hypothetical protein